MQLRPETYEAIVKAIENGADDAFFMVDVQTIIDKYDLWRRELPDIRPFYAIKVNNAKVMLAVLYGLGCGFDCASPGELTMAQDCGAKPDEIIYAHPCKPLSAIRFAKAAQVAMTTFDSEGELEKIAKVYPEAKLVLRLKVEDSKSTYPLGTKFGAKGSEVAALFRKARDLKLDIVGVAFHVGWRCFDGHVFANAILKAREAIGAARALGFRVGFLDIGGGYPGAFYDDVDGRPGSAFVKIAAVVRSAIVEHFPGPEGLGPENLDLKIISEPGTYFSAPAFSVCCQIIGVRDDFDEKGKPFKHYYINCGVYGGLLNVLHGFPPLAPIPVLAGSELQSRPKVKVVLWGHTLDSADRVMDIELPEMTFGEWLVFPEEGDYSAVVATEFNGFPIPSFRYALLPETIERLKSLPNWAAIKEIIKDDLVEDKSCSIV